MTQTPQCSIPHCTNERELYAEGDHDVLSEFCAYHGETKEGQREVKQFEDDKKPDLYYTPPSQEIFEEVKHEAIKIWENYDNTYGYVDEKVGRIKDIENVKDNLMYIVAMFDPINQNKLARKLSAEARAAIRDRLIDGGAEPEHIVF